MMKNKLTKGILAGVLSLAVAIAGFVCIPDEAQAEGTSALKWQVVDNATFADKIAVNEAPAYVPEDGDTANAGYLFAGWFDEQEGNPITSADGITGDVYAKFIPASLTGIACQIDLNDDADTRNMRVVSLIDSGDYNAVGFNIYGRYDADGNGTNETEWVMYKYGTTSAAQSTSTFTGLYQYTDADEDGVWEKEEKYPADVFGSAAEDFLFTTVSITDIPSDYFNATMAVQPYWVTKDGTYVEGMGEFNRVDDYEDGVRNISVNIKDATSIAAGMLDITLPDSFAGATVEVENGRVFDEMASVNNDGVIRCIGNVADITKNVEGLEANNVFVNLRITGVSVKPTGLNEFAVTIPEIGGFSTNKEVEATASVWDVLY